MVLTASSGARVIADQLGAYCASKAAVVNLAKHLASELGNYRINVNAICPGVVATGMTGPMLSSEAWRRMLVRETPAGRWGSPERRRQAGGISVVGRCLLTSMARTS